MNDIFSQIFPSIHPLPAAINPPRLREEIPDQIFRDDETAANYRKLSPNAQEAFLDFCMGNRGLKVTFDPFFQHIFNPMRHPERLDSLLSAILKQPVRVRKVLSRESQRISEESSLIIMDILVELANRSLVNVEMQRIGYAFPSERCFCYGADLLLSQYDTVREEQGKKFSYRDIRPVYVIVLMESSPRVFHWTSGHYIHRSDTVYDTGIKINNLLNFVYVSLDIFRQMKHNELTELEAWLYFLGSDKPQDILRIIDKYPMFSLLYQEIVDFRFHPKELISMYSKALSIMDKNTVQYMVDELKAQLVQRNADLAQRDAALVQRDAEIKQLRKQLAEHEKRSK